jgi:hypothetical protein
MDDHERQRAIGDGVRDGAAGPRHGSRKLMMLAAADWNYVADRLV